MQLPHRQALQSQQISFMRIDLDKSVAEENAPYAYSLVFFHSNMVIRITYF